jgi:hypothetical protein
MSKFAFGRGRGFRFGQILRFETLEDRRMLSLTGDAPSPYPTASHNNSATSRLGNSQSVDDGVVIGSIRAGQLSVEISVDVQGNAAGRLDAWIDFNGDGSFSGPWEQIVNNDLLSTDVHILTFDVPAWAEIGSTWARFRISSGGNMPVGSSEPNGETEDYSITILPPTESTAEFGDQQIVHDATGTAAVAKPVFAADFDGDGDADIVSATSSDNQVAWHRNNGDNTFTRVTVGSANDPRSVYAADVDGDDRVDILAVSVTDNSVYWYRNDGTPASGTWTRSTISNTASGARAVQAADIDRDGDMDVVAASFLSDKLAWYENNGSQTFTERIVNVPDTDTNSSNGNGDIDGVSAVFAADINRDGHLDIVTASGVDGEVAWFQNDGTPANGGWTLRTIRNSVAATADPAELSVVVADMNGDGDLDVVTANFGEDRIAWFQNDGTPANGIWTRRDISTTADGAYTVFAADMDSDGDMDVLSASVLDDKIALYRNNGNGIVFTASTVNTADTDGNPNNGTNGDADGATHVLAIDLNGDGDLDVISGSRNDNKVAWYSNLNEPGIVIVQTNDPLQVSESGTTDSFTVALASQPTSNVVLQILSSDTGEASVSAASLTFTPANWNTPQTVTVTGVNDSVDDGDQTSTITVRVNDASSDNTYDPLADVLISAVTTDNDAAGFTVTQSGGSTQVSETGTTDTFTVVLTSQPTSNVVIQVSSNDTGEATLNKSALTFTSANWNVAQTVTVTGANDTVVDGAQMSTIFVRVDDASSDNAYDPLPDQSFLVTTADDEVANFSVTEVGGATSVSEGATTDTLIVVLSAQPMSNVVFTILSSDTGEATVSPATLTFTNANWNVAQTVTITGVNDSILDGTQTSTITIRVNDALSDNSFDPLADKTVSVTTTDNDTSPPGDYDDDGVVDNDDYNNLWRRNFGSSVAAADGNGNGVVDAADYVLWRKMLGTSGISGSGGGGGGDAGLTATFSAFAYDEAAVDVAATAVAEAKTRTVFIEPFSKTSPPRSARALSQTVHLWRDGVPGSKLQTLATALANAVRTSSVDSPDCSQNPMAAAATDAAFASDELLNLPATELLAHRGWHR